MFKKFLTLLVLTTFFSQTLVWASPQVTPEFTVVQSVLALQGMNLSDQQLAQQMKDLLSRYNQTASSDGAPGRLRQALVDLNVYTPEEAASFVQSAQASASNVSAQNPSSVQGATELMTSEISQLASAHPAGAQFSGCFDVQSPGFAVGIAGALAAAIGLGIRFDTTSCTRQYLGSTDYYNPDGSYAGTSDSYGPESCVNAPNDASTNRTADYIAIAGGALVGIGALMMVFGVGQDCGQ